jgi:redox-sensitive bicupin YhaK (pirin superfamily)
MDIRPDTPTRSLAGAARLTIEQRTPGFAEGTLFHNGPLTIDPFLAFTDFHMTEPTLAPHPHAGFSAVTYMFRDSAGSFVNRDSRGDRSIIGPGSLHWTQAANGMMHEEIPVEPGVDCHGLQMFVNLAAADKTAQPQAFHVDAGDVPTLRPGAGVTVRVVVGEASGHRSPVEGLLTPISLLDVELTGDATADLAVPPTDRAVVLVVDGSVVIDGTTLTQHDIAVLDGPAERLSVRGAASSATVLVLWGAPINEPVVFGGPFAMTNRDDLTAANERFRRGEMGTLAPSFSLRPRRSFERVRGPLPHRHHTPSRENVGIPW